MEEISLEQAVEIAMLRNAELSKICQNFKFDSLSADAQELMIAYEQYVQMLELILMTIKLVMEDANQKIAQLNKRLH